MGGTTFDLDSRWKFAKGVAAILIMIRVWRSSLEEYSARFHDITLLFVVYMGGIEIDGNVRLTLINTHWSHGYILHPLSGPWTPGAGLINLTVIHWAKNSHKALCPFLRKRHFRRYRAAHNMVQSEGTEGFSEFTVISTDHPRCLL